MVLTFTSDSFEYRQTVIVVSKCIFIYRVTRSIVVCQVDRASRVGYSTVTVEAIPYNFYKAGDDCYAVILVQKIPFIDFCMVRFNEHLPHSQTADFRNN